MLESVRLQEQLLGTSLLLSQVASILPLELRGQMEFLLLHIETELRNIFEVSIEVVVDFLAAGDLKNFL